VNIFDTAAQDSDLGSLSHDCSCTSPIFELQKIKFLH